jgi:hypothetical protein
VKRLLTIVACLAIAGCGGGDRGLTNAALDYYEYRLGHRPGVSFSSFMSPAYKAQISAEDLQLMDSKLSFEGINERFAQVKGPDILISMQDKFALTRFSSQESAGFSSEETVRWVRVGRRWYLYMNSAAEAGSYGAFPDNIPPPQPGVEPTPDAPLD